MKEQKPYNALSNEASTEIPSPAPLNEASLINENKAVLDAAMIEAFNTGEDLEDILNKNLNELPNHRDKESFFSPSVSKHRQNKNLGLEEAVNNSIYETVEEANLAFDMAEKNKVEIKNEYTKSEINDAKFDSVMYVGRDLTDPVEREKIIQDPSQSVRALELGREKLNDLSEGEGLLNTVTSYASHMLVYKPLAENLVGDTNIGSISKDIAEYQAIEDPKLKGEKAEELTEKWWDGTNKNVVTVGFLLSQLNNPFYKENLDEQVYQQAFEVLAFGMGEIVGGAKLVGKGGKAAIKGAGKLTKGQSKAIDDAVVNMQQTFKRDALSRMDAVGNTKTSGYLMADIVGKAKDNPNLLAQLEQFTGMTSQDIYDLAQVSSKKDLEMLLKVNPKLMSNYETVEQFQSHLRTIQQLHNDIDFKEIVEKELHRKGINSKDETTFIEKEEARLKGQEATRLAEYNNSIDVEDVIQYADDDQTVGYIAATRFKSDAEAEKFINATLASRGDIELTQKIEIDINAVQPFETIQNDGMLDLVRGRTGKYSQYLFSPENSLTYGIKNEDGSISTIVGDITAIRNQQQKFLSIAEEGQKQVAKRYNSLSKKDKELVEAIVLEGDEYVENGVNVGKVFNYMELKNKGASDDVIEAYTAYRQMADQELFISNKIVRDDLVLKGYKNFEINLGSANAKQLKASKSRLYNIVGDSTTFNGVKFSSLERKKEIINKLGGEFALVEETGQVVELSQLANAINSVDIIRMTDNIGLNGKAVRYVVSNAEGKTLPETVIHMRKGYASRKYEARHYIYKENEYGNAEVVSAVQRASDVEKEINKLVKNDPSLEGNLYSREEGVDVNTQTAEDGFLYEYDVNLTSNHSFSNGVRKKELLVDAEGGRIRTKNPFEALADQVNATVVNRPVSQYRAATLKRLKETIRKIEERDKLDILENRANVLGGVRPELRNRYKNEQALIDYVTKNLMNTQDTAFQSYSRWMRSKVDLLDKKASKVLSEKINNKITKAFDNDIVGLHDLEKFNPAQALKTLNFVRLLGLFNPRQVLLQSLQTTSILSLSPVHGSKAVAQYSLWKVMGKNFRKNPRALEEVMKVADESKSSMDFAILDLEESNVLAAITNNADLTLQSNGLFSTSKKALQTINEKGMYFYDLGNEMVYSTAFFTARNEILKGAKRRLTSEELRRAQELTNKLAFNFTSANKAGFQDGISGLATQFLQVPAKAYESLVSSQFTTAEKLRLLAGNGLFFGYTGVPMGEAFVGYLAQTLGWTEERVLDEHKQAIVDFENGYVGYLLSEVFGYEVDTNNLQLFGAGVRDIPFAPIMKELFEADSMVDAGTIIKEALGPSASTLGQTATILKEVYEVFDAMAFDGVDKAYAVAKDNFFNDQSNLIKYVSTGNNFSKAVAIYETGTETDKYGNKIIKWREDEKFGRSIGAFFGLESIDKQVAYAERMAIKAIEDKEAAVEEFADAIIDNAIRTGNWKRAKADMAVYCKQHNLTDQFCKDVYEKAERKRYEAAASANDLEGRNKEKIERLYNIIQDVDQEIPNEVKLEQAKRQWKDNL